MARKKTSGLFESASMAVEYMVVRKDSLVPWRLSAEEIMSLGNWSGAGPDGGELRLKPVEGSPIVELGTTRQVKKLETIARKFNGAIKGVNEALRLRGLMLLPTGAHPLPDQQTNPGCRLELPFANDDEFAKLHTAVRMVLPIIPGLSASSPIRNGKVPGQMDTRAFHLMDTTARPKELTGPFIPECAMNQEDYYRIVFEPIARASAASQPEIDYGNVNARAATAHFDSGTIRIHVVGTQECAGADIAIAEMMTSVLKAMTMGRWVSNYLQRAWHESDLLAIYGTVAQDGDDAVITNRDYLLMLGMVRESATAREVWQHLFTQLKEELSEGARERVAYILEHGTLAKRILSRTGRRPASERIAEVYHELALCLDEDRMLA